MSSAATSAALCSIHRATQYVPGSAVTTWVLLQTLIITAVVISGYLAAKVALDRHRLKRSRATIVVVGAGPVGLSAALIAVRSGRASRVIVYEERDRTSLTARTRLLALSVRSVRFLRSVVGVDVQTSTAPGSSCWQHQSLVVRSGALLDCLLSAVERHCSGAATDGFTDGDDRPAGRGQNGTSHVTESTNTTHGKGGFAASNSSSNLPATQVELRLSTKFTRECLEELENITERIIAVVCDGLCGRSASLLGLSDEYSHHSCRAYGAVATVDRQAPFDFSPVDVSGFVQPRPPPDVRVHNLTIDLASVTGSGWLHGAMAARCGQPPADDPFPTGFHFKIFGELEHRCLALAVPRCESRVVKALKVVLDPSVMRGIFQSCYNRYRPPSDSPISDGVALASLKFSPRLFEIKLSDRLESVAFIEDANIFIVAEGETARRINFNAGLDVNMALAGLESLQQFVEQAACADNEQTILDTLAAKFKHSRSVTEEFVKNGLKESMFT